MVTPPSRHRPRPCLAVLVIAILAASPGAQEPLPTAPGEAPAAVDLSPRAWPDGEFEASLEATNVFGGPHAPASSPHGVVTGTTGAFAVRAGLEALHQGGTAVDAALTTALTQIALCGGAWVSYAGLLTLVVYDADTGEVHALNAGFHTFADEVDPLTIPASATLAAGRLEGAGRSALVPGFMSGVQAAHDRFGRLPFDQLFAPALLLAEEGFPLPGYLASVIAGRRAVLARHAATRELFLDDDGAPLLEGTLFRQPALAETLRHVAEEGAAYMSAGPWAERFVFEVRRLGGKVTLDDLEDYAPLWTEPLRVEHRERQVVTGGLPAQGGVQLAEALRLVRHADLRSMGHYRDAPRAFFWLEQIGHVFGLSYLEPLEARLALEGADPSLASRATADHAARLWDQMRHGRSFLTRLPEEAAERAGEPKHSDAVVAIDARGNVAALCHTINTANWGSVGLFVDGVSIPDAAAEQQAAVASAGPGARLPDPTEVALVLEDGAPVAAVSSIGAGLHQRTLAALVNLVEYDLPFLEALSAPSPHLPTYEDEGATTQVFEGDFDAELLEGARALGLPLRVLPGGDRPGPFRGYVVGAAIDPDTGRREALATRILNASPLGQ